MSGIDVVRGRGVRDPEEFDTGRDEWPESDLTAELDTLRQQRIDRGLPLLTLAGA